VLVLAGVCSCYSVFCSHFAPTFVPLNELTKVEGDYAFQCADCQEIFETVVEWVQHALDRHSDILPRIEPVRKQ
jgi:hypothetical protein